MTSAAIYIHTYHYLPPKYANEYKPVPLDLQERACRAYCERKGYQVFGVYRATTPPPDNVKYGLAICSAFKTIEGKLVDTGPVFRHLYYSQRTLHPFYFVRNLVEEQEIDVIVYFTSSGESGPLDTPLPHHEYASLWEIQPPSAKERLLDELVRGTGRMRGSKEDLAAAVAQINRVSEEIDKAYTYLQGGHWFQENI